MSTQTHIDTDVHTSLNRRACALVHFRKKRSVTGGEHDHAVIITATSNKRGSLSRTTFLLSFCTSTSFFFSCHRAFVNINATLSRTVRLTSFEAFKLYFSCIGKCLYELYLTFLNFILC